MTSSSLPAAPAPLAAEHVCDTACVVASETECGCGVLGPGTCDECHEFLAVHPAGDLDWCPAGTGTVRELVGQHYTGDCGSCDRRDVRMERDGSYPQAHLRFRRNDCLTRSR